MQLRTSLLQKYVDLTGLKEGDLRHKLDNLGLEVKSIEKNGKAEIYTLETLANRADHQHVFGVARELAACLGGQLKKPSLASEISDRKSSIAVRNNTEKCMRYAIMEMTLPERMQLRSEISNVLEVTNERHAIVHLLNFVLLEIGQPMHAFDRDKVDGEIIVALTDKIEKITALDGKEYSVPAGAIAIRDRKKIIALGGIIGCANSMVTAETKRVLIESAIFDPVTIRKTARAIGLSTDASQIFEKGSDLENVLVGLRRVIALCGPSAGATSDQGSAHVIGLSYIEGAPAARPSIELDIDQVRQQIGKPRLEIEAVSLILRLLGFLVQTGQNDKILNVSVPSWRLWDVATSEDLIEEFVRVYGLEKVKQKLPALDYEIPEVNEIDQLLLDLEPSLLGYGFHEVITKGFYSASDVAVLSELVSNIQDQHLAIINAVESSYSHMKVTNILHLARLAESNHRRGVLSIKVFELGRLFSSGNKAKGSYQFERDTLSMAVSGRWNENEWRKSETRDQMIYNFKGAIQAIMNALGHELEVSPSNEPFLHPGYQATIHCGRSRVDFGLIHPHLSTRLDLKNDLFYAELDAQSLVSCRQTKNYSPSSEFPAVRRDITLKIELSELASKVKGFISSAEINNLTAVNIIDDFKKTEEEFRRVTYRLTFQDMLRTLEASEVDASMQQILTLLNSKLGVVLV